MAPGSLAEDARGDDRGGVRARQPLALLVDEEHPVGVAVEGEADVGARLEHPGLQVDQVLGLDRVGGVVRERAVELAVQDLEVERQAVEHGGHDEAAHAVGGVGDDLQRPQGDDVDERADVGGEVGEQVDAADRRPPAAGGLEPGGGHGLDLAEAGVLADRLGAGEAQLDAVVLRRVVAGGEHGAGRVEVAGGEVDEVGRGQAEVDDVEALVEHALGEGRGQLDARRPHVAGRRGRASAPSASAAKRAKAAPMRRHTVGVELVGRQCPGCRRP